MSERRRGDGPERRRGLGARRRAIAAGLVAIALAAPAAAQEEAPATPPGRADDAASTRLLPGADLDPIPAPQIGRRIEETFRELQDVAPRLRRQRSVLTIRDALPRFTTDVSRGLEHPALVHLDGLSPRRLLDLEQDWSRIGGRLERWQALLEERSTSIAEERVHLRQTRRLWRATLDAEREEPLPASQRARIDSLLGRIRRVIHRLDLRMNEVLELQGELSDQGLRISQMLARITSARQRARDERTDRDHAPLWLGGRALRGARPEASPSEVVTEHGLTLRSFGWREAARFAFHAALFLVLAGLLSIGRVRGGPVPPRDHSAPLRAIRSRPVASAALLALAATPTIYPYVPSVIRGIALLAMIPALVRLAPFSLPRPRRPVVAFALLAGVNVLVSLGLTPAPVRRAALTLLPLAGVAFAGWLHKELRATGPATKRGTRWLHGLLTLSAVPLIASAWFSVTGTVERAAVWSDGTLTLIELAVVIHFTLGLLSALAITAARHRWARGLRTFRTRRRQATRMLLSAGKWVALGTLLYVALVGFDVLDPMLAASRLALRKTYEFGSIELSLGDVLSFVAVIAGTFVVVRLVHFLLSHELLPRLELGQGTEAAISLTVSYLLVALGVILAFGKAGVDPDQLALLGGALGVGIGFGLQNVVSNFVAGLILVAERPIKVGDVIQISDLVGSVQRIGIRSSTVRSLAGAEVIVPNAELISDQLINWTLTDARRRVELAVGTGYQHPPSEVRPVLENVVRRIPGILQDPPPEVLCTGFGDSSVDFVIRFWTADYVAAIRLQSVLAERVYAALAEAGIEIPFPQRDLHIKSIDAPLPAPDPG